MGAQTDDKVQETAEKAGHTIKEVATKIVHRAEEAAQKLGHTVKEVATKVEHRGEELAKKVGVKPSGEPPAKGG
jgi:hypothetical protein